MGMHVGGEDVTNICYDTQEEPDEEKEKNQKRAKGRKI